MKRASVLCALLASALVLSLAGCSGSWVPEDEQSVNGPILDMGQLTGVQIDQLFINGGVEDEYLGQGEFSVYLRDAATDTDLGCTAASDGMEKLASAGVYFGGLSVPFREVSTDHPASAARFKLLFVEQDSGGCPEPIGAEDTIVGETAEFPYDAVFNSPIWTTNGKAVAVLRDAALSAGNVVAMSSARTEALAIDKLSFSYEVPEGTVPRFYLFADKMQGDQAIYQCQIDDDSMSAIRSGSILFSALGFPFDCFNLADDAVANLTVRVSLYAQTDGGPQLVGSTSPRTIAQLVGERADFVEGEGYITFQRVQKDFFGSAVVRLADLTAMSVTVVEHMATPSAAAVVELLAVAEENGLAVACAGAAQGLAGVAPAGKHEGLTARLRAVTGQKELFGWDRVSLRLVERTDGKSCPWPIESEPTVLAETGALTAAELATGTAVFADGTGSIVYLDAN